ncbi:MAG TPA: anion transporter [Candidatus Acidoferrales bacterium]|jgi:Na+/H+ antiporter NhaD/arsenite permease-like protein|nr:anion transporter [Candidatus Acidoferrales bacterium]
MRLPGTGTARYDLSLTLSPATLSEFTRLAAYAIFLLSYLVFAIGKFPGMKIDRPGAAIIGAVLMVAIRAVRPADSLHFIDFGTIVLLFSMMLLVAYLHLDGFFDWVSEWIAARVSPRHLLPAIVFLSGTFSAFFVNDIICLIMVPFTLKVSRRMGLSPLPYLLAVATASNIGSVATITGNPQNMLIGSYSGIRYSRFLFHLGPVAAFGLIVDWLILWFIYTRHETPAAPRVDPAMPVSSPRGTLLKAGIVILLVLAGFLAGLPPAQVAAMGAAIMLMTRRHEPREVYEEVDWGLLVFFVGLFLIVGGAENVGLTARMLEVGNRWNLQHAYTLTIVTAGLSNIVSNVPAVMLLKSAVPRFANPQQGWLVLAMASTLAGNLTITGSVANIIVVERAKPEVKITFGQYLRAGVPITLITLAFGWAWLVWVS